MLGVSLGSATLVAADAPKPEAKPVFTATALETLKRELARLDPM